MIYLSLELEWIVISDPVPYDVYSWFTCPLSLELEWIVISDPVPYNVIHDLLVYITGMNSSLWSSSV